MFNQFFKLVELFKKSKIMSKISWTEKTINYITGCTKISAGCANCYAEIMHRRLKAMGQTKYQRDFIYVESHPEELAKISKKQKAKMIFINSMSDTFHEDISFIKMNKLFFAIKQAPKHTFQVLTKRPLHALDFFASHYNYHNLPNLWLGVTVENNKEMHRLETLREIPAKVRFLSIEPLLEDLQPMNLEGIHWVIIGCESGHKRRECKLDWIRNIIAQCKAQNVAVFVKQLEIDGELIKDNLLEEFNYREFPI